MQEATKNLTTPHAGVSYILLSFAHFTDGELTQEEKDTVMQRSVALGRRWNYNDEEMMEGWMQASAVHDSCETWEDMKNVMVDILNMLSKQDNFGDTQKNLLLADLEAIMNADHKQHENELYWINTIKKVWGI
jgi:hypothetical protein